MAIPGTERVQYQMSHGMLSHILPCLDISDSGVPRFTLLGSTVQ